MYKCINLQEYRGENNLQNIFLETLLGNFHNFSLTSFTLDV